MRPQTLIAATGLLIPLAAFFYLSSRPGTKPETLGETKRASTNRPVHDSHPPRENAPVYEPGLSLSPALEKEIEDAVVTYSPAGLPTFEKLLASAEPEIREAARDGLVRLGEKGGAPLLRRASARLTDPEEIKKFLDTANWLELPSALEGPLKK